MCSKITALCFLSRQYGEALKCYRKIKDTKNCVRLLERENRYDEAVRMFRAPKEALAKAVEYTSKGIELSHDLIPDNLSYVYASQCAKRKDKSTLIEMLGYMSDASRKARFLKIGGFYSEALKEYVSSDELDSAYRLASGQCMFSEGREIAKTHEDSRKESEFVFHHIHAELLKRREKASPPFPSMKFEKDVLKFKSSGDPMTKAQACLLWGIATKDVGLCRVAHGIFVHFNKAAALQAFDALTSLVKDHNRPNLDQVLTACTNAKDLQHALETTGDLNLLVKQATAFYGLQKVRDVYLTPPNHNVWVSVKLRTQCLVKDDEGKDIDGWFRLNVSATREVLAAHVGSLITKWLGAYATEITIKKKVEGFELHQDIQKKKFLLHHNTKNEVSALSLKVYMESLVSQCRLGVVLAREKTCDMAVSTLQAIFSPQVSIGLPLTKQHVVVLRGARSIRKSFHATIKAHLDPCNLNRMDEWFSAWRACCLTDGTSLVDTTLQKLEEKVNHQFKNRSASSADSDSCGFWRRDGSFQAPPAYLYWKLEDHYYHVFNIWMYSCTLIRDGHKALWAAKHAIYHFLGTISQRKSLSLSVMNLVHVLIVHCTGLFAMLTQLNHHQGKRLAKFVVPVPYPACVDLFDWINCKDRECTVFSACTGEVTRSFKQDKPHLLHNDCVNLLDTALSILLGNYRKDNTLSKEEQTSFRVLKYAFRNEKVVSSGAARHCLVLALTLFANLVPYQPQYKCETRKREFVSFFEEVSNQEKAPGYVKDGANVFQAASAQMLQSKVYQYVGRLLSKVCAKGTPTQSLMMFSDKGKITYAPLPSGDASSAGVTLQQLQSAPKVSSGTPQGLAKTNLTGKDISILQSSLTPDPSPGRGRQPSSQPATTAAPHAGHPGVKVERIWQNLPPVLDNLLHPPSSQTQMTTFGRHEQPLAQTSWDHNQYQVIDPLLYQQNTVQQFTYTALPQHADTFPPSQVLYQHVQQQQQHSSPLTAPFEAPLQPQSRPLWDLSSYDPPGGLTHQHGDGGQSDELPWPDLSSSLPGLYYPPLIQQQPSFDPYGPLPHYSSTMPSNFDWDPLATQQNLAEPSIYYGSQYTTTHASYDTVPSNTTAAVPLHIELAAQLNESVSVTSPPSSLYVPPLTDSISVLPPAIKEVSSQNGEAVVNSHQIGTVPLSEVYDANFQPSRTEQSQNPDAPQPTMTAFSEAIYQQKYVQTEAQDEGNVLFPEHVPVEEHEKEIVAEREPPDTEETLKDEEEEEEEGFGEMDEDDKALGMSALRRPVWPHLPEVDPNLIDPSIVTEEFCNICGMALVSKHAAEESKEASEEADSSENVVEPYDSHVRGTTHSRNYTLHKSFKEKFDECYTVMVNELCALCYKCEETRATSLTRLTDDIHDTLDKYDRKMAERQTNLSWRMGLTLIDKATDEFQSLLARGNKQYEQFKSENPCMSDPRRRRGGGGGDNAAGGDSDTEFHEEMNRTVGEMEDDLLTLRSETSKLESRTRKKVKKRKR